MISQQNSFLIANALFFVRYKLIFYSGKSLLSEETRLDVPEGKVTSMSFSSDSVRDRKSVV